MNPSSSILTIALAGACAVAGGVAAAAVSETKRAEELNVSLGPRMAERDESASVVADLPQAATLEEGSDPAAGAAGLVGTELVRHDLAVSRALHGEVYVGDPCADAKYVPLEKAELPILIPHAGALPDGSCQIDGWAYYPSPPAGALAAPLVADANGYMPIVLFGDQGDVVRVLSMPADLVAAGPLAEAPG